MMSNGSSGGRFPMTRGTSALPTTSASMHARSERRRTPQSRRCKIAAQCFRSGDAFLPSSCSFLALTHAAAQTPPAEPAPPPAPAAPAEPPGPSRLHYGVRFGPSFTTLTSVETFDDTAEPAAFEPTMNFGGFFNFALTGMLSLQPEVLFAAKGERIRDKGAPPVITAERRRKARAGRPRDSRAVSRISDPAQAVEAHAREHVALRHCRACVRVSAQRGDSRGRGFRQARRHRGSGERRETSRTSSEAACSTGGGWSTPVFTAAYATSPSIRFRRRSRRGVLGVDGREVLGVHALGPSFADEHHGIAFGQEDDVADVDPRQVEAIKPNAQTFSSGGYALGNLVRYRTQERRQLDLAFVLAIIHELQQDRVGICVKESAAESGITTSSATPRD